MRGLVRAGRLHIRTEALTDAHDQLALDRHGVCELIAGLTEDDWYKSMPADWYRGVVFDVYHAAVPDTGLVAYIKLYIDDERGELLVIQSCKRK